MEKLIIEENGFIEEEKYQRIKKEMKKKNDYFTAFEYEVLTQRLGEIWANESKKIKTSSLEFRLLFYLLQVFGLNNNLLQ